MGVAIDRHAARDILHIRGEFELHGAVDADDGGR